MILIADMQGFESFQIVKLINLMTALLGCRFNSMERKKYQQISTHVIHIDYMGMNTKNRILISNMIIVQR